jgi:Na+/proline symporter
MSPAVRLNAVDLTVFAEYMVVAVALGFLVSRKGRTSSQAYFLGGKTLPWYVIATSMCARHDTTAYRNGASQEVGRVC